mgnify:FL=1
MSHGAGNLDRFLERYRCALEAFSSWGVRIPPDCRLKRYESRWARYLDGTEGPIEMAIEDSMAMSFDLREVDELITIAESFDRAPDPTELERLRRLPGGSERPEDESTSRARDAQYELYLRALLVQIDPYTVMSSPDLWLRTRRWNVEAKRPTTDKAVDTRLRKAIKQIEQSKKDGFVALSLDDVIRPRGGLLLTPTRAALPQLADDALTRFQQRELRTFFQRLREKHHVLGVILTFRVAAQALDTGMFLVHLQSTVLPASPCGAEASTDLLGELARIKS